MKIPRGSQTLEGIEEEYRIADLAHDEAVQRELDDETEKPNDDERKAP